MSMDADDETAPVGTMHRRPTPDAPSSPTAAEVYEHLLLTGPRARTDLASRLGLSGPTLTRLAREMLDQGLLRELPPRPVAKGRPQLPLDVDEHHALFIGLKITATVVHAVVVDVRGRALEELSATLPDSAPETVVDRAAELAVALADSHPRIAGVGVAGPVLVDDDGDVLEARLLGWDGPVPLRDRLQERLALPVTVSNDFHALLEGLTWFGIGRRHPSFVLITIGAGVAVGHVRRGEVHRGGGHRAGLLGTLPTIARDGRGVMLADVASARDVVAAARARGLPGLPPEPTAGAGAAPGASTDEMEAEGLQRVIAAVREGEPAALDVAADVAHAVGVAAAGLVGLLDPDAVVLGGEGVGLLQHGDELRTTIDDLLRPVHREVELRFLPDDFDDWTRGAAVIALQRFVGRSSPGPRDG